MATNQRSKIQPKYVSPDGTVTLYHGDCLEALATIGGVNAVVTDPPYGIRFMGKRWDYDVPNVDEFDAIWNALRDGGRMLCFAGARTAHRMTLNVEEAGFVIEDVVMWLYGTGFPKHKSKLKPAYEPIIVARKGGVSELNIDGGRIGFCEARPLNQNGSIGYGGSDPQGEMVDGGKGRYPANVVLDEEAARILDEQSGRSKSPDTVTRGGNRAQAFGMDRQDDVPAPGDFGGASRFFYCAKASRAERNAGLGGRPRANHHPTVKPVDLMRWLVRLVAKPGDTVLDPYIGSGTTGVACVHEGVNVIGVECEAEYVDISRRRVEQAFESQALFRQNETRSLFDPEGV